MGKDYDEAELRFKKGAKIDEHFYVRQDGTQLCRRVEDIVCGNGDNHQSWSQYVSVPGTVGSHGEAKTTLPSPAASKSAA